MKGWSDRVELFSNRRLVLLLYHSNLESRMSFWFPQTVSADAGDFFYKFLTENFTVDGHDRSCWSDRAQLTNIYGSLIIRSPRVEKKEKEMHFEVLLQLLQ